MREPAARDLTVELVVSDSAVSVPPGIVVPAGFTTASFPIAANGVDHDVPVTITARFAGLELPMNVRVLRIAGNDFWIESRPTETVKHFTDGESALRAWCSGSTLALNIDPDTFTFTTFVLRPGNYDGQRVFSLATQHEPSCAPPDRAFYLTIHEADMTRQGVIRRFAATFALQCGNGAGVRGQIHLTDPRPARPPLPCGP